MNEVTILIINYILFEISVVAWVVTALLLLTPKYSKKITVILWLFPILVLSSVKFFLPLDSALKPILDIVTLITSIGISAYSSMEGLPGSLISWACISMVTFIGNAIWLITPYADAGNEEIGTTIGYAISLPVAAFLLIGLVLIKRTVIDKQQLQVINSKNTLLLTVTPIYFFMQIYMPFRVLQGVLENHSITFVLYMVIEIFLTFVIWYIILSKGNEYNHLTKLKSLEQSYEKEQSDYEQLVKNIDEIQKIRHDFNGQLMTARHIINQDRERGLEMLDELRKRLERL